MHVRPVARRLSDGVREERDTGEFEVSFAGEPLAQSGRQRRERERRQIAVVDVGLDGEEEVVAAGEVPVLGRGCPSRRCGR